MSNVVHYYYPSPTLHHHPKNGMIHIGNILTDFTKPDDWQVRGPAIPPPAEDPQTADVRDIIEYGGVAEVTGTNPLSDTSSETQPAKNPPLLKRQNKTTISQQKTAEISTAQLRAGNVGVWAKVSGIGGANIGLEWTKKHDEIFNFEKVVTVEFWPTDKYIADIVSDDTVKSILQLTRYKPLYLVTGIKAVRGAKAKTEDSSSRDANASLEGDATAPSGGTAPLNAGVKAGQKKENKLGISFEESSDFVFAFRIKKIKVNKKTLAAQTEDMTKRALLGHDDVLASLPFTVESWDDAGPESIGGVGYDDTAESSGPGAE